MLNALGAYGLKAPTAPALAPFAYFTQENVFSGDCVRAVPTHSGATLDARFVAGGGATLQEWVRRQRWRRCGCSCTARCADPRACWLAGGLPALLRRVRRAAHSCLHCPALALPARALTLAIRSFAA